MQLTTFKIWIHQVRCTYYILYLSSIFSFFFLDRQFRGDVAKNRKFSSIYMLIL